MEQVSFKNKAFPNMPTLEDLQLSVNQQLHSQKKSQNYDVIVLGVGSMGSATCFYLAKQGAKVLGLEQFDIPHNLGSHGGQSRIIRKAYFEHPDYVPLLERAYQNWQTLEDLTDSQVYFPTGLLYFGKPKHLLIQGVHESANKFQIPLQPISNEDVKNKYTPFKIPAHYEKLIEPNAGFVSPERAILLYTQEALKQGANIHIQEKTLNFKVEKNGEIKIKTDKSTYYCKKLVICAGAWTSKLIPSLASTLRVTRQVLAWVKPHKPEDFELGKFPCWTLADEDKPGIFYGFPILNADKFGGNLGLKLAYHYPSEVIDPDNFHRQPREAEDQPLIQFMETYLPNVYRSTQLLKTCLYTNTPDEHFILDLLPQYQDKIAIASGFSGHGFKFASAVGEIMADLVLEGKTNQPIEFLKADRFLK
jgi:sarcosine oxidase